jgi:hypothetical protein
VDAQMSAPAKEGPFTIWRTRLRIRADDALVDEPACAGDGRI